MKLGRRRKGHKGRAGWLVGISETDSFHDTEPGPLPIHSVRSADHFYQKSFPQKFKERPSKMH